MIANIVSQTTSANTAAAGDWNGILIDQYSHDRNVEIVTEAESPLIPAPGKCDPAERSVPGPVGAE